MSPNDFIELAQSLLKDGCEASLRTAVSRAYYAVYHECRIVLEARSITIRRDAEGHKQITECLDRSNHPPAQKIAQLVRDLRRDRNIADYDLADPMFSNPANSKLRINKAINICSQLASEKDRI